MFVNGLTFFIFIFLNAFFFVWSSPVFALDTLTLNKVESTYILGPYVEYIEDISGSLTINEISSEEYDTAFLKNTDTVFSAGYSRSVYWLRFKVDPQYSHPDTRGYSKWFLEIPFPLLDNIDLYAPLDTGDFVDDNQVPDIDDDDEDSLHRYICAIYNNAGQTVVGKGNPCFYCKIPGHRFGVCRRLLADFRSGRIPMPENKSVEKDLNGKRIG